METRSFDERRGYNSPATTDVRDEALWELARRRAGFRPHLFTYLTMSVVFWVIWYGTGGPSYSRGFLPWPVWPMFGWGIGVLFHYLGAFVFPKSNRTEEEYQKLIKERGR